MTGVTVTRTLVLALTVERAFTVATYAGALVVDHVDVVQVGDDMPVATLWGHWPGRRPTPGTSGPIPLDEVWGSLPPDVTDALLVFAIEQPA